MTRGFLQFSTESVNNTAVLTPTPTPTLTLKLKPKPNPNPNSTLKVLISEEWAVREVAIAIYYAQREHRAQHGVYSDDLALF
jgi:hypothetical protein